MNKTAIEYLDYTWNPIAMRCTEVSEGCARCWHLKIAHRFKSNPKFSDEVRAAYAGGKPVVVENRFWDPCRKRKPSRFGVQFMGDLFHEAISDKDIFNVFSVMMHSPHHTFIVLTKRPKRMRKFMLEVPPPCSGTPSCEHATAYCIAKWPLPNVVLMVTVENQPRADERIPVLLDTPAAVRGVSIEPCLSPVNLYLPEKDLDPPAISWTIVGAETGPGARYMDPAWARSIRDQCSLARIPFFFKRMSPGEETPDDLMIREFPGEPQPCP